MKQIKTISIKCDCKDFLKLEDMTVMQGNLKERNDTDYEKIKKSILTYSFSFPFFIWKSGKTNYLIDGTGRHSCLLRMQEEGYIIPDLPVVYISCKDKKDAKQKLLRLNSQYGKMTKESVLEFAEDIDLNFDEIALPDTVIDFTDQSGEIAETEGDDEAPEVDEKSEPVSKRGEMYELGNSILMCGDSTDAEDVARLMGGEKASLVLTDPPYGISVVQSNSVGGLEPPTFGTVGGERSARFIHTKKLLVMIQRKLQRSLLRFIQNCQKIKLFLVAIILQIFFHLQDVGLFGIKKIQEILQTQNWLGLLLIRE